MTVTEDSTTFRARFRFRVNDKLHVKANKCTFKSKEREVELSAATSSETMICDDEWLVMNARGFASMDAAKRFAHDLRAAAEVASVAARLGVDSGVDVATARLGSAIKKHIRQQTGAEFRDNIHGIDVFPDASEVRFLHISSTGSVLKQPEPFLTDVARLIDIAGNFTKETRDIVLLVNFALMRPEPVAQIVFAFSAVEMLGQKRDWSQDQQLLLEQLAVQARNSTLGTPEERNEIATELQKMHRVSLNQGVLRLLNSIGLSHLKKRWGELYAQRSTLVHGLAPRPGANYTQLANDTVSLCGHILLLLIAKDVPCVADHIDDFYQV